MADEPVALAVDGALARLSLARPHVLNAVDAATCACMSAHLDALEARGDVSVLLVDGGEARAFCAGADLKHMRTLSGESLRRFIELTWRVFDRVARSHLVTIAALHGPTLGGGAELALACDVRIADETLRFGFPEMTLGSVPGSGGVQRLPGIVGRARAIEMIAGGRQLSGQEAAAMGLVNACVPAGTLTDRALEMASTFASRPTEALRFMKAALAIGSDAASAAAFHGLASSVCQANARYRENTSAFAGAPDNAPVPS